jgi:hypothetical protein
MAITSYINGAGGSTGADLAILDRISASGLIYFVGNAVTGASDSNSGLDRGKPLLTTAQAYSNASAGDTIVYLESHAESIGSAVTLAKAGLSLVGEGSGSSVPRLTCTGVIAMLDITAAGVLLDNLYFPVSTAAATARVRVGAADALLNALQFDCGASDTNRSLSFVTGASSCKLTNSRFTSVAATPAAAIEVINATAGLTMDSVTFDGGSFEWSAAAFLGTAAVTRLRATRMYQLNGSDAVLATGSTGVWQTEIATGNSRLNWTA